MTSSAQKTLELQYGVKRNAEEYRNQLNDIISWEKEIKDKERDLKRAPTAEDNTHEFILPPVRSHAVDNRQTVPAPGVEQTTSEKSTDSDSNEKVDSPLYDMAKCHKEANEIKERGNNYVKLSQFEKAVEAYTDAIDMYHKDPVYFINRALCYLKLERFETCIEDCEMAIELDKHCVKAYYRRMQANEALGNHMDALRDCTTVLFIEPKNSEAKKSLQRISERLRTQAPSASGPNFSEDRPELMDILPIEKPVYKRSKRPLRRIPIVDVVCPKNIRDEQNNKLHISDEDIDKIFNSNCGPFEEIKKPDANKNPIDGKVAKIEAKVENKNPLEFSTNAPKVPTKESAAQKKEKPKAVKQQKPPELMQTLRERPLPPAPTSTAQFYTNWKELSPAQKYQYVKSIEIPNLCKILGAGFDSDTLTDLLNTLWNFYVPNKEPNTAATLLEIGKNPQTPILALLMSKEERELFKQIVTTLKQSKDGDSNSMAIDIEKYFNSLR